jgi:hypothetical protein
VVGARGSLLKSVTVKREADGWYANFTCAVEVAPEAQTGATPFSRRLTTV